MSALLVATTVFLVVFLLAVLGVSLLGADARARSEQVSRRLTALSMASKREGDSDERLDLLRHELLGSLPLMDRILYRFELLSGLRLYLLQSEVPWTVGDTLARSAAAAAIGAGIGYWRTEWVLFALVVACVAATFPFFYIVYKRSQRLAAFEQKLPGALDLICRALRAGHGLIAGMEMVGNEMPDPIGSEFRKTFEEQNFGLELKEALHNLMERVPVPDVSIVVTAILIQQETGGNLAEVLEKTAQVIRERYRLKRQIRTHTAQGRLTGMILGTLPLTLGILLFISRPEFMSVLWTTERGQRWLMIAAGLMLLGGLVIRKIIRIRV